MTPYLFQQTGGSSSPVKPASAIGAEITALELRIAEQVAEAKTLMAAQMNRAMEERVQRLQSKVAVDQAQLELLNVHLRQALERESQGGTAGTLVAPPIERPAPGDPDTAILGIVVTALVLAPLALAFAWRLIRRPGPSVNSREWIESAERMRRVEASVESIAIEIERISEHQRFITRAMSEPMTMTPLPLPPKRAGVEHPTPV